MSSPLSSDQVLKLAQLSGYRLESDQAVRIANAVGPALTKLSEVEATLPFEAEPVNFLKVQIAEGRGK